MHFFCALSILVAWWVPDVEEVRVYRQKPSVVAALLRQGLLPNGVEITADDLKSTIWIHGTREQIEETRRNMALFDFEPRRVSQRFKLISSVDKISYDGTVQIRNNAQFSFSDSETGVSVTLRPRINDDDTVTSFVTFEIDGGIFTMARRDKDGTQFLVKAVECKPMNEKAEKRLSVKAAVAWPELSVTPTIVRQPRRS